jgi:hypothetical protein
MEKRQFNLSFTYHQQKQIEIKMHQQIEDDGGFQDNSSKKRTHEKWVLFLLGSLGLATWVLFFLCKNQITTALLSFLAFFSLL